MPYWAERSAPDCVLPTALESQDVCRLYQSERMRLWSVHPRYLDAKGLVACWREALLAKAVLSGKTRGYRYHPQLERFRAHPRPRAALNQYLRGLYREARLRGYTFDARKVGTTHATTRLPVTSGQVRFEFVHLKRKLRRRDLKRYLALRTINTPELHPLFRLVKGEVESWEKSIRPRKVG